MDSIGMDPEIKAQWVKALRSGKYKQGQDALRTPSGFCCLGVLCDLLDPKAWRSRPLAEFPARSWNGAVFALPRSVEQKLRLDPGDTAALSKANDAGHSFTEIADWIEACL